MTILVTLDVQDRLLPGGPTIARTIEIHYSVVEANYFATPGNPAVSGRRFDASDVETRPEVVVERMAKRFWPGAERAGRWVPVPAD